ncbi:hypothetical protein JB92DRAFT_2738123, partial [Gautieria morchelliformis]
DPQRSRGIYGGLYDDNEDTIRMFWKVHLSFALTVVTFVMFKELNPKFCIHDSSRVKQRLPTSSTCVDLPKVCYSWHFVACLI